MPDFDAGSYFLTTLAPIRAGGAADADGLVVSHRQRVQEALMTLPTALQSPATEKIGVPSPFARNRRTHLCRFVVIDDAVFNGREPRNPILTGLFGPDPINPEPVDRLNAAYLMFCADIDAVTRDGDPLPATLSKAEQHAVRDAYARLLWETAEAELRPIYENCIGFERVRTGDDFARYLARCQVETTMPFHDYWTKKVFFKALPIPALALAAGGPLALLALAALGWVLRTETVPLLSLVYGWPTGDALGWGVVLSALGLGGAYAFVMKRGAEPLPPPDRGDLVSVLKALHVQRAFAGFAAARQGDDPAALHAAFGAFLAQHRPQDRDAPTQPPGVIGGPAGRG
jgi:hypothetical protein